METPFCAEEKGTLKPSLILCLRKLKIRKLESERLTNLEMAEAAYEDEKDCKYFADHSSQRSAEYIFVHFVVFFSKKTNKK